MTEDDLSRGFWNRAHYYDGPSGRELSGYWSPGGVLICGLVCFGNLAGFALWGDASFIALAIVTGLCAVLFWSGKGPGAE